MFETAFAKAVENKKAAESKTDINSAKNLEIKTDEEYNGNINYSLYDEYNTVGMQWAYHTDTQVGDQKVLYNSYTGEFILVVATKEGVGFVEAWVSTYEQKIEDERIYESNKQRRFFEDARTIDTEIHNFELGQNDNARNNVNGGNRGRGIQDVEVSKGKSDSNRTANFKSTEEKLNKNENVFIDIAGNRRSIFKDNNLGYSVIGTKNNSYYSSKQEAIEAENNFIKSYYAKKLSVSKSYIDKMLKEDDQFIINLQKKSYSLKDKYWHTYLSKSQLIEVEKWLRKKGSPQATQITDNANWYKGMIDDEDLFVIYSMDGSNNPTILYEVKGGNANLERNILMDLLEDEENGKSINGKPSFAQRVSEGSWMQNVNHSKNNLGNLGSGQNNQNAGVLQRQSQRNGSRAFRNVVENLFKQQEQDGELNGDKSYSLKMVVRDGMTDEERYNILVNKSIEKVPKADDEKLELIKSKLSTPIIEDYWLKATDRKKLFVKIGEEFGIFKNYTNEDIDIDFEFTKGGMRESEQHQNGNYETFAKLFSCLDEVIDRAIGVEVHNRNSEGYKVDVSLKEMYVLVSAFEDGEYIVPVKLEIKEFSDKKNKLYVAIALESIKKNEVVKEGNTNNSTDLQS